MTGTSSSTTDHETCRSPKTERPSSVLQSTLQRSRDSTKGVTFLPTKPPTGRSSDGSMETVTESWRSWDGVLGSVSDDSVFSDDSQKDSTKIGTITERYILSQTFVPVWQVKRDHRYEAYYYPRVVKKEGKQNE